MYIGTACGKTKTRKRVDVGRMAAREVFQFDLFDNIFNTFRMNDGLLSNDVLFLVDFGGGGDDLVVEPRDYSLCE